MNLRDLMIPEDVLEMEERYDRVLREHNDREQRIGDGFREVERASLLDLDVEVPEYLWMR